MQMISSGRANVVPPLLMGVCFSLIFARFACLVYDSFVTPPAVNLVDWQKATPADTEYAALLDKPILFYFVDTHDVFDSIKCKAFESTVLKNREVAKEMKEQYHCVKIDVSDKSDTAGQAIAKRIAVTARPQVVVALPNGKVVDDSALQFTDRLFASALADAQTRRFKFAGDVFMERCDFKNACSAYKRFLDIPGSTADARSHSLIRYYVACRSVGSDAEAKAELKRYSHKNDYSLDDCIQYLRGELTADKLLVSSGKYGATTAKYAIGMKEILDGNKADGIKQLHWVASRGDTDSPDYAIARGELKKLGEEVPPAPEEGDPSDYHPHYE
jgi:hypothetical protein